MTSYSLETNHLTHHFSESEKVLNEINLQVLKGSIYGFLGPNGAGKTTTIRVVLGLLKKQQGIISFFGIPFYENRIAILRKVGSLIESPSLYAHLTATENLMIYQKIYQCPKIRVSEVLNLVGLSNTNVKKINQFSLGMKQRLSIAVALLHSPSLLILDEPTNGLDPNGIIEIRELLKKLNREKGITIFISSHLLSEIEKLVSHVGIINKGTLMFQGTLEELKSKQTSSYVILDTSNAEKALKIITDNHWHGNYENERLTIQMIPKENIAILNRQLVSNDIDVYEMRIVKNDLETIFMDLINK